MVLELPQDIFWQVGSGSLVMELKVDVRQTEEVITSKGGPIKYEFYNIPYDWAEAERHCQKQGGHLLASVHSKKDQEKLEALSGFQDVWLGGGNQYKSGWKWTDGSVCNFSKWRQTPGKNKSGCLQNRMLAWDPVECTDKD